MEQSEKIKNAVSAEVKGGVIYFIGIGGIGMSALARYFHFHGKKVSGYDKTRTPLTDLLEEEGISVHYEDDLKKAPRQPDLIVYTPAIPTTHSELNYFREQKGPLYKRSEVLGMITETSFNICVAGTHGKTTVSTMIAHLLRHSGYGCNAFLGGISVNYGSNFWSDKKNVCVVEADEYDRSFLKLVPDIAVITAMDADHLEIYGDEETMHQAFIEFSGRIRKNGILLHKHGLIKASILKSSKKYSYHLKDIHADIYATGITVNEGSYHFSIISDNWELHDVILNMGGLHNVENAVASIVVAHELGISDNAIRDAVSAFKGVRRRFEYIVKKNSIVYIDDYAHHPEELRALISGAQDLFKGKKITIIFQPHLFSRTKDFAAGFAKSLDMADEVLLLPIYPARELPIEGVTSDIIVAGMNNKQVSIVTKELAIEKIKQLVSEDKLDVLITAGAGDIDMLVPKLRNVIEKERDRNMK
ncbi:MAG TPA: UDP-N-acetylmuramate--L-alanine ligase [Flavitalea sp.]|nr:UDP-N-acetylmuramate--L-alanine ligase [Flavitalea sp.]